MSRSKRILVAPLDWGLGHATRCIPVITELLERGAEVIIAADKRPLNLLRREFPSLQAVTFPGYDIEYPVNESMLRSMLRQLPSLYQAFRREHRYLETLVRLHRIDAVISDNRFGAYSRHARSVYLVHQLNILLPPHIAFGQAFVSSVNRRICERYDEVWIPDHREEPSLGGPLSHSRRLPRNAHYIGPLSRLQRTERAKEIDVLAVLSGPEPQRTLLEERLAEQMKRTGLQCVIVRGKPEQNVTMRLAPNVLMVNSMNAAELSAAIASARMVVSRPGYSTVMDLSHTGARAIFIPTPQQTEQEHLARSLRGQNVAYSEEQNDFDLVRALAASESFTGFTPRDHDRAALRARIDALLKV